jgi:pantoate--beta-alanine ligase
MMKIAETIAEITAHLNSARSQGKTIGFVPTMGALHDGHLSIIATAKAQTDIVVCSIFVNPTQFDNPEHFKAYPKTLDADIEKLGQQETNILFLPSVAEIYPAGTSKASHDDLGYLETALKRSPGSKHLQGVGQVVQRLLEIIKPHKIFKSIKDYQQCLVIKKIIEISGLDVVFVPCPTHREGDGLAISSRNKELTTEERRKASAIYKNLQFMKGNINTIAFSELKILVEYSLESLGFNIHYVAIAHANSLELLRAPIKEPMVVLIAAWLGEVRLIDNILIDNS